MTAWIRFLRFVYALAIAGFEKMAHLLSGYLLLSLYIFLASACRYMSSGTLPKNSYIAQTNPYASIAPGDLHKISHLSSSFLLCTYTSIASQTTLTHDLHICPSTSCHLASIPPSQPTTISSSSPAIMQDTPNLLHCSDPHVVVRKGMPKIMMSLFQSPSNQQTTLQPTQSPSPLRLLPAPKPPPFPSTYLLQLYRTATASVRERASTNHSMISEC